MENLNLKLVVKQVTEIIKKYYSQTSDINQISKKHGNDIVTDIDIFMEKNIIKELSALYPTHSFLAEESGETAKNSEGDFYRWIIDPIDGTINFAAGLPDFGIVVALQKNGETILGVTYLPKLKKLYTAIKGHGAYCNGKKIHVSKNTNLNDCLVMVYLGVKHNSEEAEKTLQVMKKLLPKTRGIRIVGSSAAASCWVASGEVDAIINLKVTRSLGSTAGRLFISEAGGMVTNLSGQPRKEKDSMLCSNGLIHHDILKLINVDENSIE